MCICMKKICKIITAVVGLGVCLSIKDLHFIRKNVTCSKGSKESQRYRGYYGLLLKWFQNVNAGKTLVQEIRKYNNEHLVIYGMGTLGELVYNNIKGEVRIDKIIDGSIKNKSQEYMIDDVKVIGKYGIAEHKDDFILVTPVMDYQDIKKELNKYGCKNIVSLETLVYNSK